MILVLGKVGQRATFLLFAVLGPFLAILFRLLQGKFFLSNFLQNTLNLKMFYSILYVIQVVLFRSAQTNAFR